SSLVTSAGLATVDPGQCLYLAPLLSSSPPPDSVSPWGLREPVQALAPHQHAPSHPHDLDLTRFDHPVERRKRDANRVSCELPPHENPTNFKTGAPKPHVVLLSLGYSQLLSGCILRRSTAEVENGGWVQMRNEESMGTLPTPERWFVHDDLADDEPSLDQQVLVDGRAGLPDLEGELRKVLRFTGDDEGARRARRYYSPMPYDARPALLEKLHLGSADPLVPATDRKRLKNFSQSKLPRYYVRQRLALPQTPGPSPEFSVAEMRVLSAAYRSLLRLFQNQKRVARATAAEIVEIVIPFLPERTAAIQQRAASLHDDPTLKAYLRAR